MSSSRSEKSWHYGDRGSRQWDGYDDRQEDWRKPQRSVHRDTHRTYGGDRHGSTERLSSSRRREYSTSPNRGHSRDSRNRDWDRKSPVKRRLSPPEKRHRRFTEREEDTDYRYKSVLEDEPSRHLPDPFARGHATKDLKRTLSQEDDSKHRETTQDFRQRYHDKHQESTSRQQHDNGTSQWFVGNRDRNGYELNWDHSGESAQSPESLAKPREMRDSTIMDHVDHSPRGFPLRPSPGQAFQGDANHQRPAAATADQTKSTMGFQRFLEVLNKGVNVAALNQIVTQSPPDLDDRPLARKAPNNIKGEQWAVSREAEQHKSHLDGDLWSEMREPQEPDSPQRKECSRPDKVAEQKGNRERKVSETSTPVTPSVLDTVSETSHEENKQKHEQMLNILEAIGVNLGSEELDQMSLRIQQRLYGRKERDGTRDSEPDQKPADSPRRESRSPSSRSSFSPPAEDYSLTADHYDVKRGDCLIEIQPNPQYCQESSSSSALQDNKESQEMTDEFSQNPMYTLPKPAHPLVLPPFPNCLPPPVPGALPGALPGVLPGALSGALPPPIPLPYPPPPPMLPLVVRRPVFPHLHPFLPRPPVPPVFPEFLSQMMRPHPAPFGNPPPPPRNPPYKPFSTTQQSKGPSRPRCLQVVQVEKALKKKTPATGDL